MSKYEQRAGAAPVRALQGNGAMPGGKEEKPNFNPNERSTATVAPAAAAAGRTTITITFGPGFQGDKACTVILRPGAKMSSEKRWT